MASKCRMKKTIVGGNLVRQVIYDTISRNDSPSTRQTKQKVTKLSMQYLNGQYAWQKLEMLLAANLKPGDLFVTLTYTDARLPATKREAQRDFSAFVRKVKKRWPDGFCYFYRIERCHGKSKRWHIHACIPAGAYTPDDLEKLWGNGHIKVTPIEISVDMTWENLARYLIKEKPDRPGEHQYGRSRHLNKPVIDRVRVDGDAKLTAPEGAVVLYDSGVKVNDYYVKSQTIKFMYL